MPEGPYDLLERTARFGEAAIDVSTVLPRNPTTAPLLTQFVRAATSVGANYCEADEAESKRDFRHKIALCRKETKETRFWCRMLARAVGPKAGSLPSVRQEALELHLIFCQILRTTDANLRGEEL